MAAAFAGAFGCVVRPPLRIRERFGSNDVALTAETFADPQGDPLLKTHNANFFLLLAFFKFVACVISANHMRGTRQMNGREQASPHRFFPNERALGLRFDEKAVVLIARAALGEEPIPLTRGSSSVVHGVYLLDKNKCTC